MMPELNLHYESLKKRHRDWRENCHTNLSLRAHRALSWLQCAEHQVDLDAKVLFLWISFNATYAAEMNESLRSKERSSFCTFLDKLVALDSQKLLENHTWNEFPKSLQILLNQKFVHQPFWDFNNRRRIKTEWGSQFKEANATVQAALVNGRTTLVLSILLSKINSLRNQLVHGGATWRSSVNSEQMSDYVAITSKIVPIVLEVIMDNPRALWGDPYYPVVQ